MRTAFRNIVFCVDIDGPWGHDVKWNKPDHERQINATWYYLYVGPKKYWIRRNRKSGCEGLGVGENRERLVEEYTLPVMRWIRSEELMYV